MMRNREKTFTIIKNERYQRHLLVIASAIKTALMFLFGMTFLIAPTPEALQLLRNYGFSIPPAIIAGLIFILALCYPTLIAKKNWSIERRHQWFLFGSAPVFVYFFLLVFINVFLRGRISPSIIFLGGICTLFLIFPAAIFYGYRRAGEIFTCVTMFLLMTLTGISFALMPNSMIFSVVNEYTRFHLVPMSLALSFIVFGLGYIGLMFLRNLPPKIKPLIFGILALPIGLYDLLLIYNAVRATMVNSLILPLAILDLTVIIILIGCALYQPVLVKRVDDAFVA